MPRPLVFCCEAARLAFRSGELQWNDRLQGWIMESAPLRDMTHRARWLGGERGVEDHSGEFYVWQSCFRCGQELPYGELPPPRDMRCSDGDETQD